MLDCWGLLKRDLFEGIGLCNCVVLCLVAQSWPTLCNAMDCSSPGSCVNGDSPSKNTGVGCLALLQGIFPTQGSNPVLPHCRRILYHSNHQGSPSLLCNCKSKVVVAQSCPTLWDPMDCSPPGSSIHRIFQARILEWVTISFSRRSSWPRDWTPVSCLAGRLCIIW